MANITIQQAYALAKGILFQFSTNSALHNRGSISSAGLNTRATSQKNNKLSSLIATPTNAAALDLGDITYVNRATGSSSTILADGANPSDNSYNLVSTSANGNGGTIMDYLEGSSSIDSTTGTLSAFEADLHKTGRVIFNKLKK